LLCSFECYTLVPRSGFVFSILVNCQIRDKKLEGYEKSAKIGIELPSTLSGGRINENEKFSAFRLKVPRRHKAKRMN
jgi:hypothetical protein